VEPKHAHNSIDRVSLVSIWHDNSVVFGTHVNLGALTILASCRVDVLSSLIGSDETDTSNVWVLTNLCDGITTALNHIDDTSRDA